MKSTSIELLFNLLERLLSFKYSDHLLSELLSNFNEIELFILKKEIQECIKKIGKNNLTFRKLKKCLDKKLRNSIVSTLKNDD